MDKSSRTVFVCQQCGKESPKWLGHCPGCQSWNTFAETRLAAHAGASPAPRTAAAACELSQITSDQKSRIVLPFEEFNRVLGGGIVPGSLILISGDPGIGKSTLLLQVSAMMAQRGGRVVYVSGEESPHQVRLRADRLNIMGQDLLVLPETDLEVILGQMEETPPALGVIDSVQTVYLRDMDGAPGSISQVRGCTLRMMQWAKASAVPLLLIGHVTKEGAIAGPKVLEHIVDVVLYLEGESFSSYRLLRSAKNRFGSTNEVGIFEMKDTGLVGVENPSQVFLTQRRKEPVGSVIAAALEGTRPLLVEIQALTSLTSFGLPRRNANGIDYNRLLLVLAVLARRAGLRLSNQDIIVNVVGGLKVNEPAMDLAIALSISSSLTDKQVDPNMVVVGEIGLSGEVRGVPQLDRRLGDAVRQGFTRCLVPRSSLAGIVPPREMEILAADSLRDALKVGLQSGQSSPS